MNAATLLRINLYTKKKKVESEDTLIGFAMKIPLATAGVCLAFSLLLFFTATWQGLIHTNLKSNLHKLQPEKETFDVLKNEVLELNKKVSALNQLKMKGFRWSKKLNQISEAVIPGIWLRDMYLEQDEKVKKLILEGSAAYPGSANETVLVSQFIQKLKDDKDFFESFSDVELKGVSRRKIKDTEVMDFVLSLPFKEGERGF
jgi:hypothetical protein